MRIVMGCLLITALLVAGIVLRWRGGSDGPGNPAPRVGIGGAAGSCEGAVSDPKPALKGLVTISSLPAAPIPSFVGGLSVNVRWADLQTEPAGQIVRPNVIDQAISDVRDSNRRGSCLGIKLRVMAGVDSPDWAKNLDGPPLILTLPQDALQGSVPRFWADKFGVAYATLQQQLAATYDGAAEIREIVVSRCTTFYAEPLVRQGATDPSEPGLAGAGLTTQADVSCFEQQIEAHKIWKHTASSLALNPYAPAGARRSQPDLNMALHVADQCRTVLGNRCILANNSIRTPVLGGKYQDLYAAMKVRAPVIEFQTAAPARIGDVAATVSWAIDEGASSVELEPSLLRANSASLAEVTREAWSATSRGHGQ